ncbi:DUF4271 domain-containing protein [Gillisia sp. M10.2A]|uniref:DUF4271 domain-containing protein n=1 Tax=Gillisia lutea TaxID=2909668 RepID=A0ABS9EDE8_9FLAO|nr:DUF4271 domain-containing protein [Gillisia lutea]MCF4100282.1 DUF4271 domain-containing protein [Gillisia lutea]
MEAIERYSTSNDLLTLLILLVLVLMLIAKQLFQQRFSEFVALLSSSKYMVIKSKEHKALFGFNLLLFCVYVLSVSLFLFVVYRNFISGHIENTGVILLRIITGYSFFVLLKITVEKIIANVFDIDDFMDFYLFQKQTYRNFLSVLLFPVSIFLVYAESPKVLILYIIAAIFLLASLYTFTRIIQKNQRLYMRNWFYFILYLCALEITPYVILYKLIINSSGV